MPFEHVPLFLRFFGKAWNAYSEHTPDGCSHTRLLAVARVFEVDPNTVLQWLIEAADHLQAFSRYFLHHIHVSQVQLDELFALLSAVKADEVSEAVAQAGWQINTAFIERVNLSIRQHVAAVGRRVLTLCKHEAGFRQQLALYHAYHNFCLPHASLRLSLPQPLLTNGSGSAKTWQPCTPAMAAGLTNHVWTLREVLLFRVPPWPQP